MYFPCKLLKTTDHNLTLNDQHVEFVNSLKYLSVTISRVLSDKLDIKARVRSIYRIANMLRTRFFKCSVNVKNILLRYFCSSIYGINLWCRYPASSINRLRVAYNNAYRILFNLPRRIHTNETMVNNGISTFHSLMRKHTANLIIRCKHSSNAYIQQILGLHVFLILIFQYITQNYILAKLARMFMLCVVPDKFVCVFLFFVLLWTFVESDTNNK